METYTLAPEGFQPLKRRMIGFSVVIVVFIVAAVYFPWLPTAAAQASSASGLINLLVIFFITLVMAFQVTRGIRQQNRRWLSYKLTLSPTDVTKTQDELPVVTIPFEEITQLQEFANEGLSVRTARRHDFIFIPVSLNGYEEVKSRLAHIREIEPKSRRAIPLRLVLTLLFTLGAAGLMIAVMQSHTASFVLPVGLIMLLFLSWGLFETQRSKLFSQTQRRLMWFMLLPLLALLGKLISVLQ
jgi:hypothetical protein